MSQSAGRVGDLTHFSQPVGPRVRMTASFCLSGARNVGQSTVTLAARFPWYRCKSTAPARDHSASAFLVGRHGHGRTALPTRERYGGKAKARGFNPSAMGISSAICLGQIEGIGPSGEIVAADPHRWQH